MSDFLKATETLATDLDIDTTTSKPVLSAPLIDEVPEMTERAVSDDPSNKSLAALLGDYLSPPESAPPLPPNPILTSAPTYKGTFVRDVTIVDGQVFPPGAEFVKVWRMLNDGETAWPESTQLNFTTGTKFSGTSAVKIGEVLPGTFVHIETSELKAPEQPGRYVSYWHLNDGKGTYFGSSIWLDITVAETHFSDGESSLAASTVVMPYNAHTPYSANGNQGVGTSARPSDGSSVAGSSIGSSVSLISVPTSATEDDSAWDDSRSRTTADSQRSMNYVVLYDDETSDEE